VFAVNRRTAYLSKEKAHIEMGCNNEQLKIELEKLK